MLRAFAVVLALCGTVHAAAPLRLTDALRRIAEQGPDQAVAQAAIPIAVAEVTTARMFPNPGLTLSGGQSEPVFSATLNLRLPIFGQLGARARAAGAGVDQVRAEAVLALWRLRRDGRLAYYGVARAEAELVIARRIEALTRRVAEISQERFDAGAGNRLEKEQAALVHTRATQDVVDRQAVLKVTRLELARQLALDPAEMGTLGDALEVAGPTPPLADLLGAAVRAHPELTALGHEHDAALLRAQAARADRRPTFGLDLGLEVLEVTTLGCNGPSRCAGPRVGLAFDLPIFNLNRGPIARAEMEARAATIKAAAAGARITTGINAAYETWRAAEARASFFDDSYVPAALSVEAMAREGFAAGRTGLLPLIEAQRAVLDAEIGRVEARFAVQAARADLEEASGVTLSAP